MQRRPGAATDEPADAAEDGAAVAPEAPEAAEAPEPAPAEPADAEPAAPPAGDSDPNKGPR